MQNSLLATWELPLRCTQITSEPSPEFQEPPSFLRTVSTPGLTLQQPHSLLENQGHKGDQAVQTVTIPILYGTLPCFPLIFSCCFCSNTQRERKRRPRRGKLRHSRQRALTSDASFFWILKTCFSGEQIWIPNPNSSERLIHTLF